MSGTVDARNGVPNGEIEHFPIRSEPFFFSFPYVSIKTPFLVTSNDAR